METVRGRPRCAETHDRILCSCRQVLNEVGFADTTIESIAARAGVGKTTIYRRWPDKGALALEAFLQEHRGIQEIPPSASARQDLTVRMLADVEILKGPGGKVLTCVIAACLDDPLLRKAFHESQREGRAVYRELLERAQRNGEVRPNADLETAIDGLFGPIHYRLLLGFGELDMAFVMNTVEQVFKGIS